MNGAAGAARAGGRAAVGVGAVSAATLLAAIGLAALLPPGIVRSLWLVALGAGSAVGAALIARHGQAVVRRNATGDAAGRALLPLYVAFGAHGLVLFFAWMIVGRPTPLDGLRTLMVIAGAGGLAVAMAAVLHRVPAPPSCGRCGYPVPMPDPPARCPECGADLSAAAIRRDRPAMDRRWIRLGLLVAVIGFGLHFAAGLQHGRLYAALPTRLLLTTVARAPGDDDAWRELGSRRLAGAGLARAVEVALAAEQTARGDAAGDWLAAQALAGRLDPAQLDRLFAEAVAPRLRLSRDGWETRAWIETEISDAPALRRFTRAFYFLGFQTTDAEGAMRTVLASDQPTIVAPRGVGAAPSPPTAVLLPAGNADVSARVLVVVLPPGMDAPAMDPTGSDPPSVLWSREFVLEPHDREAAPAR